MISNIFHDNFFSSPYSPEYFSERVSLTGEHICRLQDENSKRIISDIFHYDKCSPMCNCWWTISLDLLEMDFSRFTVKYIL